MMCLQPEQKYPEIAVVIPVYNGEKYIDRAINSVLSQTYPNVHCIVVNDGSNDNSSDIIKNYTDITFYSQNNKGASAARNKGIEIAVARNSKYIAFLDQDDYYEKKKLESSEKCLKKNFDCLWVHTPCRINDNRGDLIRYHYPKYKTGFFIKELARKNFICNSTPLYKVGAVNAIGGFDENTFICADWELNLRMMMNWKCCYDNDPLTVRQETRMIDENYLFALEKSARYTLDKIFNLTNELTYFDKAMCYINLYWRMHRMKGKNNESASSY